MLRRDFMMGALATAFAVRPARAEMMAPFRRDLWPPMARKDSFVSWMSQNRNEDSTLLAARFDRYQQILGIGDLRTADDRRAFLMTPREEFVLPEDRANAYVGHYLDMGFGVSITPPGVVGRMTSALAVRPGDRVLEIGTGSGYQSALLSYLTDDIFTIEIIPELAARTRSVYEALVDRGYSEYSAIQREPTMATTVGRRRRPSTRSS